MMPKMISSRTGRTSANSTAAAPRSPSRLRRATTRTLLTRNRVVAHLEQVFDHVPEEHDSDHRRYRNEDRQQCVLDGRRSPVRARLEHGVLSSTKRGATTPAEPEARRA